MPLTDHQRKFKNVGKSEELRRRRAEGSVELRKTRKDEHLMKKRNIDLADNDLSTSETSDIGETAPSPDPSQKTKTTPKVVLLPLKECMRLFRDEPNRFLEAVENIRRSLSRQTNPAVDDVIHAGALPYLVDALDKQDPKIQFEAAWALTNVSSGTSAQTRQVIALGALPKLIRLLDSEHFYLAEQVCWALGNITGDCADLRDMVIKHGILPPLLRLCSKTITIDFIRTISWTISNLCRNKNPPTPDEAVAQLLPIVSELLEYGDHQVRMDACWAAAYLSDATDDRILAVINHGIVQKMVRYLNLDEPSLIAPALRCLGNIVTGDDNHTQAVINSGVLKVLTGALVRGNKNVITKEGMWLLSNITAGNQEQIQAVIDEDLLPVVIEIIKKGDAKSQHEACWVIGNLVSGGSIEQVSAVLEKFIDSLFYALCEVLKCREPKVLCLALDCIEKLLEVSNKTDKLERSLIIVEECGGLDKIESLQSHTNEDIYQKALGLIEKFFNEDEEANISSATESQVKSCQNGQEETQSDAMQFTFNPSNPASGGFTF